jgi:hypothetical protein
MPHLVVRWTLWACCVLTQTAAHASEWGWDNPRPQGNALHGVHGAGSARFAVGSFGSVLRDAGDGRWQVDQLEDAPSLAGVWAASADLAFAVSGDFSAGGRIYRFSGGSWSAMPENEFRYLAAVWGAAADEVYAVGHSPAYGGQAIQRFDGQNWAPMSAAASSDGLYGVSGWGPGRAVAVGANRILRLSPADPNWQDDTPEFLRSESFLLRGVWAFGEHGAVAVGRDSQGQALILHRDAAGWQRLPAAETHELRAVWGSAANQVFAVGNAGVILHFDGNTWQSMDSSTTQTLYAVWGTASDAVDATGHGGHMLHFDGQRWRNIQPRPAAQSNLSAIHFAAGVPFISGSSVSPSMLRRLDGEWQVSRQRGGTGSLWAAADGSLFAVGRSQAQRFDGSHWEPMSTGVSVNLHDVHGRTAQDVWAVGNFGGNSGTLLHFNGNTDLTWQVLAEGISWSLDRIWSGGSAPILASTSYNRLFRWNGSALEEITPADMVYPRDLWGAAGGEVFFVAGSGGILRCQGSACAPMAAPSATYIDLFGHSNQDIYALASNGTLLHFDGNPGLVWQTVASDFGSAMLAGAVGPDGELLLVGLGGRGFSSGPRAAGAAVSAWTMLDLPTELSPMFFAVAGSAWNDLQAVGSAPLVLLWNGTDWRIETVGEQSDLKLRWIGRFADSSRIVVGGRGSEGSGLAAAAFIDRGSGWEAMTPSAPMLLGAHASSASEVYAVGWQGAIRYYDGNAELSWRSLPTDTTRMLYAVHADAGQGLAVGDTGTVVVFDLNGGSASQIGGADILSAITRWQGEYFLGGRRSGDLRGAIYRGGPGQWTEMSFDVPQSEVTLIRSFWADGEALWAASGQVGDASSGGGLYRYDGNAEQRWQKVGLPTDRAIRGMAGVGGPGALVLVGADGTALRRFPYRVFNSGFE